MSAFSAAAADEDGDIIKTLQAHVADLEAQLYAVGAGGVGSTVARQDHHEQNLNMVPAGWKLVPVQPTRAMLDAGRNACEGRFYQQDMLHGPRAMMADQFAAMLAAAPQLPVVEQP